MSDYLPAEYTIPACVTGDTFPSLVVDSITVSGVAPANTLASVRMDIRTTPTASTASKALTSAGGDITIDSAANWGFTVEPFAIALTARTYYYDIETTDSSGTVRTYLTGTWKVVQDVTRT